MLQLIANYVTGAAQQYSGDACIICWPCSCQCSHNMAGSFACCTVASFVEQWDIHWLSRTFWCRQLSLECLSSHWLLVPCRLLELQLRIDAHKGGSMPESGSGRALLPKHNAMCISLGCICRINIKHWPQVDQRIVIHFHYVIRACKCVAGL